MTDFIDGLERDLVEAAERRQNVIATTVACARPRVRPPLRSFVLAALLALAIAGSAAAGTLLVLRGSVIPGPSEQDAGPAQTPAPGSAHVEPLTARDPGGGLPWALRIAKSRTGLVCGTVGQRRGRAFGLVGLDGRFRALAPSVVDGCGQPRKGAAAMVGTRVFDARRRSDVRTVVSGIAGAGLRKVSVSAGGAPARRLRVGPQGTFLLALRGYPEDIGIDVRLEFAGGTTETRRFGSSAFVIRDPLGARAWKLNAYVGDDQPERQCLSFTTARPGPNPASSPSVCGTFSDIRRPHGYFFAVRRIEPTGRRSYSLERGSWFRHAPRTAVWGQVGTDVVRVDVIGPNGTRRARIAPNDGFLVLFSPKVDPRSLRVRVKLNDGSVRVHRGDTRHLPPKGRH